MRKSKHIVKTIERCKDAAGNWIESTVMTECPDSTEAFAFLKEIEDRPMILYAVYRGVVEN